MLKKIFVLLIINSFFVSAQSVDNNNFTGSLHFDSKFAFDNTLINFDENVEGTAEKKSPFLAGLFSFIIPGSGQAYNNEWWKTAIFVAIETAAITTAIIYDGKGDDQTVFYENFANQHWSVNQYAQWTIENATTINSSLTDDDVSSFNVFNGESVNWNELNALENAIGHWYSHRLAPLGDQQYYEMIGKYPQFAAGWDDFNLNESYTYGDPLPSNFLYYAGERGKANDFYSVAKTMVSITIVNHIISAVEAAWGASRYNKTLDVNVSMSKLNLGFYSEYYPQVNFKYNFSL